MITLDELRTALLASNPYEEVDRLIRAELGSGRKTAAIHQELLALVKPVRSTPGLTEDADEALFGALDGLTGYCHPDSAYKDPPEPAESAINPSYPPSQDISPRASPKSL